MTTWAGRIPEPLAPEAWAFLHSLPIDRFLWTHDIRGTLAHVQALREAGLLKVTEARKMSKALRDLTERSELIEDTDEDVHSAIERLLTEELGDLGRKVHTARSRNDQVATAMHLWARDAALRGWTASLELAKALTTRAQEHAGDVAPGYTHLQRAQPVSLGHWLAAHAWAFLRDADRFRNAHAAANVSPLGAGALATSTLDLDPRVAAGKLKFGGVFQNSLDAVADRDYLLDLLYAASTSMTHLSRLAEELVVWSSTEFGYVTFPDSHATGSSMMPQKKNPDVPELVRGESAAVAASLAGLLGIVNSTPFAYDRDLQADKRHAPEAVDVTVRALMASAGLVSGTVFHTDRLADAAGAEALYATDLAEAMVRGGLPFRTAHERVGLIVRLAVEEGYSVRDIISRDPSTVEPLQVDQAFAALDPSGALERRSGAGGPSPASVRQQVRDLRRRMGASRKALSAAAR